jgi:hypothetical protein
MRLDGVSNADEADFCTSSPEAMTAHTVTAVARRLA